MRDKLLAMLALHSAVGSGVLSLGSAYAIAELIIMQAIDRAGVVVYLAE
jgi:hypothetical protein